MAEEFELDKSTILGRLGGDEDLFAAMAGMYLQDWNFYYTQISAALEAADAPLLQRQAHTVKSLLASFSDDDGAALAYSTELRARDGELSGLEGLVAQVQERLRLLAVALAKENAGTLVR